MLIYKKFSLIILILLISLHEIKAFHKLGISDDSVFLMPVTSQKSLDSILTTSEVSSIPYYPKCKDLGNNEERFNCTMMEIQKQIMLKYVIPDSEREKNINGIIILSFIVDTIGNIGDIKIEKGINPALNKEAFRVAKFIKPMVPGINLNKPTSVLFTIPIQITIR